MTRWTPPRWVTDAAVAATTFIVALLLWLDRDCVAANTACLAVASQVAVALAATATPLLWRRRAPLLVLLAQATVMFVSGAPINTALPLLATGVYAAAAHSPPRSPRAMYAATAGALSAYPLLALASTRRLTGVELLVPVVAWLLGQQVRARRTAAAAAAAATVARERQRAAEHLAAQRHQLARDLHDTVAHHIGVIVLHAAGGQRLLRTRPDEVAGILDTITDVGRQALDAMPHLLHTLRSSPVDTAGGFLSPPPTLRDLPALAQRFTTAGLTVELTDSHLPDLPRPEVDTTAYRIVQEALTNVARHADAHYATVSVTYDTDTLHLTIRDDGAGPRHWPLPDDATSHGLDGIRERVALVGGTCTIGPHPDGGFAVCAQLPLATA